jgi:hypothetical protein
MIYSKLEQLKRIWERIEKGYGLSNIDAIFLYETLKDLDYDHRLDDAILEFTEVGLDGVIEAMGEEDVAWEEEWQKFWNEVEGVKNNKDDDYAC